MLRSEIIALSSVILAEHRSTLCSQIGKILNNLLTPKDLYKRRTAQLTSRRCILYIYSTNMRTEYFKHAA